MNINISDTELSNIIGNVFPNNIYFDDMPIESPPVRSHVLLYRDSNNNVWESQSYDIIGELIGRNVDIKHMIYDHVLRPIDVTLNITGCKYDEWEVRYHKIIYAIMKEYHYDINDINKMIYYGYIAGIGTEMGI